MEGNCVVGGRRCRSSSAIVEDWCGLKGLGRGRRGRDTSGGRALVLVLDWIKNKHVDQDVIHLYNILSFITYRQCLGQVFLFNPDAIRLMQRPG